MSQADKFAENLISSANLSVSGCAPLKLKLRR